MALEYADLSAALYLAGGSDHAARLLAAAAEQVLGDLARLLGDDTYGDEMQTMLSRIALRYQAPVIEPRSFGHSRKGQLLDIADGAAGHHENEVRNATGAYLRASWYMLESMGLEAVIPARLQQAVDNSTIFAPMDP